MSSIEELKKNYTIKDYKILLDPKTKVHASVKLVSNNNLDRTPIMIIPGGPGGDSSFYYNHVDLLIKHGPLLFFDPRGTGESDKHDIPSCTLEQHIVDIETIRSSLELPKLTLFATSYGGMVGIGYAVRFQKYLDKLVLGVTAPSERFISEARNNLQRWGSKEQQKNGAYLLDGKVKDDPHFVEIFESLLSLYSMEIRQNPNRINEFPKLKPGIFNYQCLNLGYGGFLNHFDFTEDLKNINVPTLILGGKYDWICDVSFSYLMSQQISNSHLCVLPGGHNLLLDCPTEYRNVITTFMSKSNYSIKTHCN